MRIKNYLQYVNENYRQDIANQLDIDASEFEDSAELGDMVDGMSAEEEAEKNRIELYQDEARELLDMYKAEYGDEYAKLNTRYIPGMGMGYEQKVENLVRKIMRFCKEVYEEEYRLDSTKEDIRAEITRLVKREIRK